MIRFLISLIIFLFAGGAVFSPTPSHADIISKNNPRDGKKIVETGANQGDNVGAVLNHISPDSARHILQGDRTGGGHLWPGGQGKTPFPQSWSGEKILHEISDIATDPNIPSVAIRHGRVAKEAMRDGVKIRVIIEPQSKGGKIMTGYPTNLKRNPK